MVFLDVSMFAGVNAVAGVVALFVSVVGVVDAFLVFRVVGDFVALEFVLVVLVVAVDVALVAGISADFVLFVGFGSALVVSLVQFIKRVVQRRTLFKVGFVDLVALPAADVVGSRLGVDSNNESDKKFHCLI